MDKNSNIEINKMIMMELGLEGNKNKRVFDQDTFQQITMNGKALVEPGCASNRLSIEFNPYENPKMMEKLFGLYIDKIDEDNTGTFYHVYDRQDPNKSAIEYCTRNSDGSTETIRSRNYCADSLKYLDLVMQLNHSPRVNLDNIDYTKNDRPEPIKNAVSIENRKEN